MSLIIIIMSLSLDWMAGEPKRWHPLVGFGSLAKRVEAFCYKPAHSNVTKLMLGGVGWLLLVLPLSLAGYGLSLIPVAGELMSVLVLYLSIGHKSLYQHVLPIVHALDNGDERQARELVSRIVSRDKDCLDVTKASIESVLENGNDAVFAALFWFIIAGLPGVIAYRLSNTLDAMWGYKTHHYLYFGRIAARIDDLMNYLPARLTALSYSLLGKSSQAWRCWQTQAKYCESPNAGPVMAAGAGALDVALGGAARYHGQWLQRPELGSSRPAQRNDILRALRLVSHSIFLWLAVICLVEVALYA